LLKTLLLGLVLVTLSGFIVSAELSKYTQREVEEGRRLCLLPDGLEVAGLC
jgi:hypothetical protein